MLTLLPLDPTSIDALMDTLNTGEILNSEWKNCLRDDNIFELIYDMYLLENYLLREKLKTPDKVRNKSIKMFIIF